MLSDLTKKLEKIIGHLKTEIASLRTGRATPALVENLEVEYYGTKTPLKALAAISSPEARQLVIQPWDKQSLPAIEKAIQSSALGINPIADRDVIRLAIPPLTEERRREMVKLLGRHVEDARIALRQAREDELRSIDRQLREKTVSENEHFRRKQELQKTVDEHNKKIEDIASAKEKEIISI